MGQLKQANGISLFNAVDVLHNLDNVIKCYYSAVLTYCFNCKKSKLTKLYKFL